MTLDSALLESGMVAEAAVALLMWRVRLFRVLPAFFAYVCWSLLSDALYLSLQRHYPAAIIQLYLAQLTIGAVVMFAVLVELTQSVLRPIRNSLPRRITFAIPILYAVAAVVLWPIAGLAVQGDLAPVFRLVFRLDQTFAILRVVVFLALVAFSQFLSIGWRNRELQVATGLGFYSLASLSVNMLHTYQAAGPQYHKLDQALAVGYLLVLVYWAVSFAQKEPERREFSPGMSNFLEKMAGSARSTRQSLEDKEKENPGKRDED